MSTQPHTPSRPATPEETRKALEAMVNADAGTPIMVGVPPSAGPSPRLPAAPPAPDDSDLVSANPAEAPLPPSQEPVFGGEGDGEPNRDFLESLVGWSTVTDSDDPAPVEVSPEERELFWRTFLTGDPWTITITMGPATLSVRNMTQMEYRVVAQALSLVMGGGLNGLGAMASCIRTTQLLAAAVVLEEVNGATPGFHFRIDRDSLDVDGQAKALTAHYQDKLRHLPVHVTRVVTAAVRRYNNKQDLCLRNIPNRSFSGCADAG